MAVQWGVIGTANIATKVARAISLAPNAELVAIASRNQDKAREWARTHNASAFYGSYHELLRDSDIDAVYIPLPPSMHAEWTIKAADHGKHVLCEKPLSISVEESLAMIDTCRKNHVQLMDGVMWVHHDRATAIRELLDGTLLGDVRRTTAAFAFNWGDTVPTQNIRARKELGGGSLGDLGYYCVRAILWTFRAIPARVFASARYAHDVDVELSGMLMFDDGRVASIDCGFTSRGRSWFEIAGSEASLIVDDFVVPASEESSSYRVSRGIGDFETHTIGACVQEARMIEHFSDAILSGSINDDFARAASDTVRTCSALARSAQSDRIELVDGT